MKSKLLRPAAEIVKTHRVANESRHRMK
jgi:hypothetical protein